MTATLNVIPPEDTVKIEELESSITWLKILKPHQPKEQKSLLMELHAFGEVSDERLQVLINYLQLENA